MKKDLVKIVLLLDELDKDKYTKQYLDIWLQAILLKEVKY